MTSLHLRHNSFSNPFVALPTSQLILQPFRYFTYVTVQSRTLLSFSYVTSSSLNSPGEPPMINTSRVLCNKINVLLLFFSFRSNKFIQSVPKHRQRLVFCAGRQTDYFSRRNPCSEPHGLGAVERQIARSTCGQ